MEYKEGDRIKITCKSWLRIYRETAYIEEMVTKESLMGYYYNVKVTYHNEITKELNESYRTVILGIDEFELDKQYYREKHLNELL